MKFFAVVFAIILVIYLDAVAANKLTFNDLIETHGEQENNENNHVKIATEGVKSDISRKNCRSICLTFCKNKIADIISFTDLIEAYEKQQNIDNNNLFNTNEEMTSLSRTLRACYTGCLSTCKKS